MYGDTNETQYNGDYMYAIDTGKTATKRYWPDEEQGQTTCSSSSPCTEKPYTWTGSEPAKISLMYIHDIDYAYPGGNPGDKSTAMNAWLFFQKDGYNTLVNNEWFSTRWGVYTEETGQVRALLMNRDGTLSTYYTGLQQELGVRPVFYLSPNAKIFEGDGTKDSPFMLS